MARISAFGLLTGALAGWLSLTCSAQSIYSVSIDTSRVRGSAGKLIFDITSNRPLTNRVDVINFTTDGSTDLPESQGELVTGDLVQHSMPAKLTRIKGNTFFTELALPFVTFGDFITFTLNVSETGPSDGRAPDEFALFLAGKDGQPLASAREGQPELAITITGERGGLLEVAKARRATAAEVDAAGTLERRAAVTVEAGWTPEDPSLFANAQVFEGDLTEFCNRRCKGEKICTGGAFGLAMKDDSFYPFDDTGNLMAQVALVESGQNPLVEGQWGHAKVVGVLKDSVLTIREISFQ